MENKIEFIKLLLLAILCNFLTVLGLVMMKIAHLFTNVYFENGCFGIGAAILCFTVHYVAEHEPKRRIKAMHDNWFVYRYKL